MDGRAWEKGKGGEVGGGEGIGGLKGGRWTQGGLITWSLCFEFVLLALFHIALPAIQWLRTLSLHSLQFAPFKLFSRSKSGSFLAIARLAARKRSCRGPKRQEAYRNA